MASTGVAVTGEDDLALLGELEAALDGTDRLGEHRTVGGAAADLMAPPRPWNGGQIDVVRLQPIWRCAPERECRASVAEVGPAAFEESE